MADPARSSRRSTAGPALRAGDRRAAPARHRQPGPHPATCRSSRSRPRPRRWTSSTPIATRTRRSRPTPCPSGSRTSSPRSPSRPTPRSRPSTRRRRTSCRTRPAREPGFKVPHKVKFEMVSADVAALADAIRPKLTTAELREVYKARDRRVPRPSRRAAPSTSSPARPTSRPHDAFPDVRDRVASDLAEEKAQRRDQREDRRHQEQRRCGPSRRSTTTPTTPRASRSPPREAHARRRC